MTEDLISNNFAEDINKSLIKRNVQLMGIVLILVAIYALLNLADWYFVLSKAEFTRITFRVIFLYRLFPVISVSLSLITIIAVLFILRANKLINMALENNDAGYFNKGYQLFYRSGIFSTISYSIAIVSILIRISFKL